MACDRHNWRALLIPVCILGLASTAGCLRSSMLRPAVEPVLEPQSSAEQEPSANERLIVPPSRAASASQRASQGTRTTALEAGGASLATPLTSVATPALSGPGPTALAGSSKPSTTTPAPPDPASELTFSPTATASSAGPGTATMSSAVATDLPAQSPARVPAAQSVAVPSPVASSTPLIDAAIQRVEALTRQQRESSSSADSPDEPEKKPVRTSPGLTSAQAPKTAESDPPLPIVLARSAKSAGSTEPAKRPLCSPELIPPGQRASTKPSGKKADPPPDRSPENPPPSLLPLPRESVSHLDVANLQLCRKVNGFGSFEPLAGTTVRPGQRVLLYCEMTGLRYEAIDAGFASRLSSRVELRAADNETVIWDQELGIARDVCPRVRHDYYVSYRLTFPRSLPAGPHRLRVVQTDLAANRSASSEILLTVGSVSLPDP